MYYVKRNRLVKIGTTQNLPERLDHLGCKLGDVLAVELGSYGLEMMRHRQFAHLLADGREHFRLGLDLKQHIMELRKAAGN